MITYLKNQEYDKTSRYQVLRLIEDPEESELKPSSYLETQNQRVVRKSDNDQYHIVTHAEVNRLDLIADKYYGDASFWWAIALANEYIDPFIVNEGTMVRIPSMYTLIESRQRILAR